jgi:hypothetical protein
MAALANIYTRVVEKGARRLSVYTDGTMPGTRRNEQALQVVRTTAPVRAFANDDIFFYVKRIDNSRVVRQIDPKMAGACWKTIATAGAAAVLVIGILLPGAYGLLAGYRIQALTDEAKHLRAEQSSLEVEAATVMSPAHMEELAREQLFIDPAPQKVVYLDSRKDGSAVALNHMPTPGSQSNQGSFQGQNQQAAANQAVKP